MITYLTGDLLQSSAEALVNTVNCEGYMGKGIAYQFKLQFPQNNEDYVKACKNGSLTVGRLHYFKENGKIVINFPTKDKWRANSKIEYIQLGLNELVKLISELNIKSIAIPPLGSGNGGLIWSEVRPIIEKELCVLADTINIFIYEPSKSYSSQPIIEPRLSLSALVLMDIKSRLKKFNTFRLQKTAYFMNVFSNQQYFKFQRHKYGPYDNSIAIISKNIKEFQKYHNVKSTNEAYDILYNKIVSGPIEKKLSDLKEYIVKASEYVNSIDKDIDLECLSTILFLIQEQTDISEQQIVNSFKAWSENKANRYTEIAILNGVGKLYNDRLIDRTLTGYCLSNKVY